MKIETKNSSALRYKLEIVRDGVTIKSTPFSRYHMITDAGLDKVGSDWRSWIACIATPLIGEGVTPTAVRRDSGSIVFTQAGSTITASSSFFVSGDTGRLLKYGTGENGAEVYLTYVNPTTATASLSLTISTPTVGTVWYVNTASLQTPIAGLSWSKNNNALENFSTAVVNGDTCEVTNQITFFSSALSTGKTVTEIAFSDTNVNSNVFDRDLITPSVALLAGDQAKITVQLLTRWKSTTGKAVGNIATGYDSSGVLQLESLGMANSTGIAVLSSSGVNTGGGSYLLEPGSANVTCGVYTTPITHRAFVATDGGYNDGVYTSYNVVPLSYGTGNRYRDITALFTISQANGNIYGITIGSGSSGGRLLTLIFTTPFTKSSSQVFSFTWRKSWSRVLIN